MAAGSRPASDLDHVSFAGKAGEKRRPLVAAPARRQAEQCARVGWVDLKEPNALIVWLLHQAGVRAEAYRAGPLQRRLGACLRAIRATSVSQARRLLEERPELVTTAVTALLLGVSEFFRDTAVFEQLESDVLPELGRRHGVVRIWSAACSDGQELYSMAMLLSEQGLLERSALLGTDCRADAVRRAREGLFLADRVCGLSIQRRERYFVPEGRMLRIHVTLRSRTRWQVHDLLKDPPAGGTWDLVLWRNTAVYLKPASAAAIWQKLAEAIRPGGFLVTGRAERPAGICGFTRAGRCVYRKLGG